MAEETGFTYVPKPVEPVTDVMKPLIDRAIRERIAALTDRQIAEFAVGDILLGEFRPALSTLLAPEGG